MTDLRTAAQQALRALELVTELTNHDDEIYEAITALRAALAQQAEPVAWCSSVEFSDALKYAQSFNGWRRKYPKTDMPLYTAPPQRKPLTEEEATALVQSVVSNSDRPIGMVAYGLLVVGAIERAHGIGGQE